MICQAVAEGMSVIPKMGNHKRRYIFIRKQYSPYIRNLWMDGRTGGAKDIRQIYISI